MADYKLYYWRLPFRGQFVRAVLAHVGASWEEAGLEDLRLLMDAEPAQQLIPHMGPPVLTDHEANFSISQTQAILTYLGGKYALIPADPARAALTAKIIADANDVLYEITLHNGAQMWTQETWSAYRLRLTRWMSIFEEHGRRHGLTVEAGHILGTDSPGIGDLVVYVLWGVMTSKLPELRPLLDVSAPGIAGLCDRIARLPEQRRLRLRSDEAYADEWCSGNIEASLRAVL